MQPNNNRTSRADVSDDDDDIRSDPPPSLMRAQSAKSLRSRSGNNNNSSSTADSLFSSPNSSQQQQQTSSSPTATARSRSKSGRLRRVSMIAPPSAYPAERVSNRSTPSSSSTLALPSSSASRSSRGGERRGSSGSGGEKHSSSSSGGHNNNNNSLRSSPAASGVSQQRTARSGSKIGSGSGGRGSGSAVTASAATPAEIAQNRNQEHHHEMLSFPTQPWRVSVRGFFYPGLRREEMAVRALRGEDPLYDLASYREAEKKMIADEKKRKEEEEQRRFEQGDNAADNNENDDAKQKEKGKSSKKNKTDEKSSRRLPERKWKAADFDPLHPVLADWFDNLMYCFVFLNVIVLASSDPYGQRGGVDAVRVSSLIIMTIFFFEQVIRAIALGVNKFYRLYGFLTLLIVIASLVAILCDVSKVVVNKYYAASILLTFRLLKPLRYFKTFEKLTTLSDAIIGTVVKLFDVIFLFMLFLIVASVSCQSFLAGSLRHRCVNDAFWNENITGRWNFSVDAMKKNTPALDFVCGGRYDQVLAEEYYSETQESVAEKQRLLREIEDDQGMTTSTATVPPNYSSSKWWSEKDANPFFCRFRAQDPNRSCIAPPPGFGIANLFPRSGQQVGCSPSQTCDPGRQRFLGVSFGYRCPPQYTCELVINFRNGWAGYDNFGMALQSMFVSTTMQLWFDIAVGAANATNISLIFFFIFFVWFADMLNGLIVVKISLAFETSLEKAQRTWRELQERQMEDEKKRKEIMGEKSGSGLFGGIKSLALELLRQKKLASGEGGGGGGATTTAATSSGKNGGSSAGTAVTVPPENDLSATKSAVQEEAATATQQKAKKMWQKSAKAALLAAGSAAASGAAAAGADGAAATDDNSNNNSSAKVGAKTKDGRKIIGLDSQGRPIRAMSVKETKKNRGKLLEDGEGQERPPERSCYECLTQTLEAWSAEINLRTRPSRHSLARNLLCTKSYFYFTAAINACNVIIIALFQKTMSKGFADFVKYGDMFCLVLLSFDCVLRIYVMTPRVFVRVSKKNVHDLILMILAWIDVAFDIQTMKCLRVLRSWRPVELLSHFPAVYKWVKFARVAIASSPVVLFALFCLIFVFALSMMQILGGMFCGYGEEDLFVQDLVDGRCGDKGPRPRAHFDDFGHALLTSFQIVTGDNWDDVMYNAMSVRGWWMGAFFSLYYFFGSSMMLALLTGIILSTFEQQSLKEDVQTRARARTHPALSGPGADPLAASQRRASIAPSGGGGGGDSSTKDNNDASTSSSNNNKDDTSKASGGDNKQQTPTNNNDSNNNEKSDEKIAGEVQATDDSAMGAAADRIYTFFLYGANDFVSSLLTGKAVQLSMFTSRRDSGILDDNEDDEEQDDQKRAEKELERLVKEQKENLLLQQQEAASHRNFSPRGGGLISNDSISSPQSSSMASRVNFLGAESKDKFDESDDDSDDDDDFLDLDNFDDVDEDELLFGPTPANVLQQKQKEKKQKAKEEKQQRKKQQQEKDNKKQQEETKQSQKPRRTWYQYRKEVLQPIARHKITDNLIMVVIIISIIGNILTLPNAAPDSRISQAASIVEIVTRLLFVLEAIFMITAYGIDPRDPQSYLRRTRWHVFEFVITVVNFAAFFANFFLASDSWLHPVLSTFTAIRPLRIVRRSPAMSLVLRALFSAIIQIRYAVLAIFLLIILYAIAGVQLFAGKLDVCTYNITMDQAECEAKFGEKAFNNPIPSFDTTFEALFSVFVIMTLELWTEIMYSAMDIRGLGLAPAPNANAWAALYFVGFAIIGGWFCVSIFMSVLVESYNRCKRSAAAQRSILIAREQNGWIKANTYIMRCLPNHALLHAERHNSLFSNAQRSTTIIDHDAAAAAAADDSDEDFFGEARYGVTSFSSVPSRSRQNFDVFTAGDGGGGGEQKRKGLKLRTASSTASPTTHGMMSNHPASVTIMDPDLEDLLLSNGPGSPLHDGGGGDAAGGGGGLGGSGTEDSINFCSITGCWALFTGRLRLCYANYQACLDNSPMYKTLQRKSARVIASPLFALTTNFMTVANFILLCLQIFPTPETYGNTLSVLQNILAIGFVIEAIAKILGESFAIYITSKWNKFDFFVAITSLLGLIFNQFLDNRFRSALWSIRMVRLVKIFRGRKSLATLVSHFGVAISSLFGVFAIITIFYFSFAVFSTHIFGRLVWQQDVYGSSDSIGRNANFATVPAAMYTLVRISFMGNWPHLYWGMRKSAPGCERELGNCGPGTPIPQMFFVITVIFFTYICRNMVLAVLIDSFASAGEIRSIQKWQAKAIVRAWMQYDPEFTGVIRGFDAIQVLRRIPMWCPIGFRHFSHKERVALEIACLTLLNIDKPNENKYKMFEDRRKAADHHQQQQQQQQTSAEGGVTSAGSGGVSGLFVPVTDAVGKISTALKTTVSSPQSASSPTSGGGGGAPSHQNTTASASSPAAALGIAQTFDDPESPYSPTSLTNRKRLSHGGVTFENFIDVLCHMAYNCPAPEKRGLKMQRMLDAFDDDSEPRMMPDELAYDNAVRIVFNAAMVRLLERRRKRARSASFSVKRDRMMSGLVVFPGDSASQHGGSFINVDSAANLNSPTSSSAGGGGGGGGPPLRPPKISRSTNAAVALAERVNKKDSAGLPSLADTADWIKNTARSLWKSLAQDYTKPTQKDEFGVAVSDDEEEEDMRRRMEEDAAFDEAQLKEDFYDNVQKVKYDGWDYCEDEDFGSGGGWLQNGRARTTAERVTHQWFSADGGRRHRLLHGTPPDEPLNEGNEVEMLTRHDLLAFSQI